ncbi:MAG: FliO/MopB family protein [Rhodospirillales bacterium]|nr:FliO/MopB family protein [Rhodospirillales bacterium]
MEIGGIDYMKFTLSLIFVLGLIAGLAVVAKRVGLGNRGPVARGRNKRLSIVETMALDAKRRVVIVRHDDIEHLILLGGSDEHVISSADGQAKEPITVGTGPRSFLKAIEQPQEAAG